MEKPSTQEKEIYKVSPTYYDKVALLLTRKYESIKQIPPTVSYNTIERSRSKLRIYNSLALAAITGILLFTTLYASKRKYRGSQS